MKNYKYKYVTGNDIMTYHDELQKALDWINNNSYTIVDIVNHTQFSVFSTTIIISKFLGYGIEYR